LIHAGAGNLVDFSAGVVESDRTGHLAPDRPPTSVEQRNTALLGCEKQIVRLHEHGRKWVFRQRRVRRHAPNFFRC
jgi:hypothetical protein